MKRFTDIAYYKIHPAIGVAHLGTCNEDIEFFESIASFQNAIAGVKDKDGNLKTEYDIYKSFKSGDHLKKQSVQFSIHAYDKDGKWLMKLDARDKDIVNEKSPLAIKIKWNIKLSNRKLHNYSKKSDHKFYLPEVKGELECETIVKQSPQVKEKKPIQGKDPWTGRNKINLGEFENGRFIPPIAKLYNRDGEIGIDNNKLPEIENLKKSQEGAIDPYPADGSINPVTKDNLKLNYTDNTSDGMISAEIIYEDDRGNEFKKEAISAWLVVAPPKTNIFFTPAEAEKIKNTGRNFFPLENTNYNLDFIKKTSELLDMKSIPQYEDCKYNCNCPNCIKSDEKIEDCHCLERKKCTCEIDDNVIVKKKINKNKEEKISYHLLKSNFYCENNPKHLDYFMMSTINGDYDPGMEICLSGNPERNESDFDIKNAFMKPGLQHVKGDEIRVKPFDEQAKIGTKPGQLTSGLCSTWQGDLIACLNFWTAENPLMAYAKTEDEMKVLHNEIKDLQKEKGKIVMHKELENTEDKEDNINNRFQYAEEIVKSMSKRSSVYHEYDEDGNVYFIKVQETGK